MSCLTGVDAILSTKRFNQLGGLQLDRDVRGLIGYAAELTQRPVRRPVVKNNNAGLGGRLGYHDVWLVQTLALCGPGCSASMGILSFCSRNAAVCSHCIISERCETMVHQVRDKFAILNQKAVILSLESAEEILEYWGDNAGPMNWRLSADDIRAVLRQRDDFQPDEIAGLLL